LRDEVDAVVGITSERQAPQALIAQHDPRLVLELVAPTLRLGDSDELMEIVPSKNELRAVYVKPNSSGKCWARCLPKWRSGPSQLLNF
jgi:hypothetical protein